MIETQDDLTGLGAVLSSADLTQDGHADLVVGCPWSSFKVNGSISDADSINMGSLLAFHSSSERKANATLDARRDASLSIDGAGYEWLGQSSLLISSNATGMSQLLAVGAPGHRNSSGGTVGAVHFYSGDVEGADAKGKTCRCTIEGGAPLGEFGASLAVTAHAAPGSAVLAIGSPGEGEGTADLRAGAVRLLTLSSAFVQQVCTGGRVVTLSELRSHGDLTATITGPKLSRLGRVVEFFSTGGEAVDHLLVAAPLANAGPDSPIVPSAEREVGAIFGWQRGLPRGHPTKAASSATWHSVGVTPHGRLGSSLVSSGQWVLAGAPLASTNVEMGGQIAVVNLTPPDGDKQ